MDLCYKEKAKVGILAKVSLIFKWKHIYITRYGVSCLESRNSGARDMRTGLSLRSTWVDYCSYPCFKKTKEKTEPNNNIDKRIKVSEEWQAESKDNKVL